ncbi:MAG TPA: hypothetical protein PK239_12445 [Chitinophagales bacterium]|nr:hypothetical protein [Chitinophagales bacterium]
MERSTFVFTSLLGGILFAFVAYLLFFRVWYQHYKEQNALLEEMVAQYADSLSNCVASRQFTYGSGQLLFNDTFDDNLNKWDTRLQENGMKIVYDGKYIIDYKEKGYFWWSWLSLKQEVANFKIVLKTRHKLGSPDKPFGIILSLDTANYYRFGITHNGYVSVNAKKNGNWQTNLVSHTGGFKTNLADDWNLLEVVVRGITLTYFANGKKVKDATLETDKSWKRFGVYVEDRQTVEFDEITITELTN